MIINERINGREDNLDFELDTYSYYFLLFPILYISVCLCIVFWFNLIWFFVESVHLSQKIKTIASQCGIKEIQTSDQQ